MVKEWVTGSAGIQVSSPSCEAVSVQVPLSNTETVKPDTSHAPLAESVTANPELAVGVTAKVRAWPVVRFAIALNVMICWPSASGRTWRGVRWAPPVDAPWLAIESGPQQKSFASELTAQLALPPASMDVQTKPPETSAGADITSAAWPEPTCPSELNPQQ
jgi:hypothetical protein